MIKQTMRIILTILITVLALISSTTTVTTQSWNDYNLWWTVDCGGASNLTAGAYTLGNSIGQADAGVLTGGDYVLLGGFWHVRMIPDYTIFLPLVMRVNF